MKKRYMKPNLYMDFDGTLVSNKQRLYRFFINNIPEEFRCVLSEDIFWELKRKCVHEIDWLNNQYQADLNKDSYNELKKRDIEKLEYLQYEELLPHTIDALLKLRTKYRIILISRRSMPEGLYAELDRFAIRKLLDEVHVIPHDKTTKGEYIKKTFDVSGNDVLVGDTEDDITAGYALQIKTYLVLSGIRDESVISRFGLKGIKVIPDISLID